jgi:hypothetical protein
VAIAVGPFSNRSASEEEALKSVSYCENEIESGSLNVNDGVVCATAGALKATAFLVKLIGKRIFEGGLSIVLIISCDRSQRECWRMAKYCLCYGRITS